VARLQVSDDKLSEHIQTKLDVRHSLDHADWDRPCDGDDEGKDDRGSLHPGVVAVGCTKGESDHDQEQRKIPPSWYELVLAHETHVDVVHLAAGGLEALPDLTAVVQVGVGDESSDGGETDAVRERE
jgi:hypothetical protein